MCAALCCVVLLRVLDCPPAFALPLTLTPPLCCAVLCCLQVERVLDAEHRRLRETLWELLVKNAPSARR